MKHKRDLNPLLAQRFRVQRWSQAVRREHARGHKRACIRLRLENCHAAGPVGLVSARLQFWVRWDS